MYHEGSDGIDTTASSPFQPAVAQSKSAQLHRRLLHPGLDAQQTEKVRSWPKKKIK